MQSAVERRAADGHEKGTWLAGGVAKGHHESGISLASSHAQRWSQGFSLAAWTIPGKQMRWPKIHFGEHMQRFRQLQLSDTQHGISPPVSLDVLSLQRYTRHVFVDLLIDTALEAHFSELFSRAWRFLSRNLAWRKNPFSIITARHPMSRTLIASQDLRHPSGRIPAGGFLLKFWRIPP